MKPYAIAAMLSLLPVSSIFAEVVAATPPASLDGASANESAGKSKLLNEVESWRATKLPHLTPPSPITAEFEPRLDEIKAQTQGASDDSALDQPRRDFESWKNDVLRRMYDGAKAAGLTHDSFSDYAAEEESQAQFFASLQTRLAQFASAQARSAQQQLALRNLIADPSRFDGGISSDGNVDLPVVAPSISIAGGMNNPARYDKIRQLLIWQGAKPYVVDLAIQEALRQNADPLLVLAVIKQESNFKPHERSSVGARGLMQIMPGTGRILGVRDSSMLYDAQTNLHAGIRFLKDLWGQFVGGSMRSIEDMNPLSSNGVKSAVAAYNAGPNAVVKYSGVPPYRETQGYVKSVLGYYAQFKQFLIA